MGTRTAERTEFLGDIITTAVEGGTGYWAQVSQYQWTERDGSVRRGVGAVVTEGAGAGETRATLHEMNDDGDGYKAEGLDLTIDKVATAIGKLVRGEVKHYTAGTVFDSIKMANEENDAGEIDADGADVIAQVALLGEVVYG